MLGIREPGIYGHENYPALVALIEQTCDQLDIDVEMFQSNYEGAIVDRIQAAYGTKDAIVINPAAYTHTSVAILDALKAVSIPAVEVHLSDVNVRETFRHISYPGMACEKTIVGKGFQGYVEAIQYLKDKYG
jgi:3-dehydroquinate dehydratase-2